MPGTDTQPQAHTNAIAAVITVTGIGLAAITAIASTASSADTDTGRYGQGIAAIGTCCCCRTGPPNDGNTSARDGGVQFLQSNNTGGSVEGLTPGIGITALSTRTAIAG
ncbi:hypothetical protein GCM10007160_08560 [Litchfieldella qijiaojingensis]|uniref:Uncharacterized protein n=1 Tax=Litchfieldella qijiaojingensis TaxID=980347 RepID=A0ABQ2YGS7_9GAMM|nr:hypothetical protein GCM10007160_08560 [Halomonas qijiaojingensis]